VTVPPIQFGFSELHHEVGVCSPGPAGVDPGVKHCRRSKARVPQQLPYQLVRTRVSVENDFGGQVPELVRCQFHSQIPQYGLRNSHLDCVLFPRLTR